MGRGEEAREFMGKQMTFKKQKGPKEKRTDERYDRFLA